MDFMQSELYIVLSGALAVLLAVAGYFAAKAFNKMDTFGDTAIRIEEKQEMFIDKLTELASEFKQFLEKQNDTDKRVALLEDFKKRSLKVQDLLRERSHAHANELQKMLHKIDVLEKRK
jgi:preprotein translocase subunit SecF